MTRSDPPPFRLLALLAVGWLGTGAELLLLDHVEGFWQKVPLVLVAFGLVAVGLCFLSRHPAIVRLFQAAMILALAGGIAGLYLHFDGNMEFELEMHPDERGWPLIQRTLKGATPALSPGMMIFLGSLGLMTMQRAGSGRTSATTGTDPATTT